MGAIGRPVGHSQARGDIRVSAQLGRGVWNRREILAAGCAAAGTLGLGESRAGRGFLVDEVRRRLRPVQDGAPELLAPRSHRAERPAPTGRKPWPPARNSGIHYWESYPAHVPMNLGLQRTRGDQAGNRRSGVEVDRLRRRSVRQGRRRQPPHFRVRQAPGNHVSFRRSGPGLVSTISTSWSRNTTSPSASTTTGRATATPRSKRSRAPSRTIIPRSAAASTPAISSARRSTRWMPSRRSARGSMAST